MCRVISQLIFPLAFAYLKRVISAKYFIETIFFLLPCAVLIVEEKEEKGKRVMCVECQQASKRAFNEGSLSLFLRSLLVN